MISMFTDPEQMLQDRHILLKNVNALTAHVASFPRIHSGTEADMRKWHH